MKRFPLVAFAVAVAVTAFVAGALPAAAREGQLALEVSSPSRQVLRMQLNLPGVTALWLQDGRTGETLLAVQGPEKLGPVAQPLHAGPAEVALTLGKPELVGLEPEVTLPRPFQPASLKVVFVEKNGSVEALEVTGTLGALEKLTLAWRQQRCPTMTLTFSNGCRGEASCCSPRFCTDCVSCEITCGQSCALP